MRGPKVSSKVLLSKAQLSKAGHSRGQRSKAGLSQGQPSKLRSNGVISKDGVKQVGPHPVGLRATRRQRREVVALWGLMGRHGRALRQLILRNRA